MVGEEIDGTGTNNIGLTGGREGRERGQKKTSKELGKSPKNREVEH